MKRKNHLLKVLSLVLVGALTLGFSCTPAGESTSDSSSSVVEYTPHWNDDGVLKILAIGNSFSEDAVEHLYALATAAGIENIELGHLYLGGCSLEKHLRYIKYNSLEYLYSTKNNGKMWRTSRYNKAATAFADNDWDFVTLQQSSDNSGIASTYDDLNPLLDIIESQCTNEHVAFAWHMTWAYQHDSPNKAFPTYNSNQTTMYNAIISAVQEKVVPNNRIVKIIPSGTAIQNARTSYLGDTLTRDGHHLSQNEGRLIAGASFLASLIDINFDSVDLSSVCSDASFVQVLKESVKNAVASPFRVTPSLITEKEDTPAV